MARRSLLLLEHGVKHTPSATFEGTLVALGASNERNGPLVR